jgi:hypothetical protein
VAIQVPPKPVQFLGSRKISGDFDDGDIEIAPIEGGSFYHCLPRFLKSGPT